MPMLARLVVWSCRRHTLVELNSVSWVFVSFCVSPLLVLSQSNAVYRSSCGVLGPFSGLLKGSARSVCSVIINSAGC
jgi:hypothetical protein